MSRLVLYEPDVLYAVIGYYNKAIFPAQAVALLLALAAIAYTVWPHRGGDRIIPALLAAGWLWSGIVYLGGHYAAINWAGAYYEAAFVVQAAMLLGWGVIRGALRFRFDGGARAWAGAGFAAIAIVIHPLVERALGRGWAELQYVGVSPDPTELVTLALLLMSARRVPWWLLLVPALWLVIAGGWAWLLGTPERMILPACSLVALVLIIAGTGRKARARAAPRLPRRRG